MFPDTRGWGRDSAAAADGLRDAAAVLKDVMCRLPKFTLRISVVLFAGIGTTVRLTTAPEWQPSATSPMPTGSTSRQRERRWRLRYPRRSPMSERTLSGLWSVLLDGRFPRDSRAQSATPPDTAPTSERSHRSRPRPGRWPPCRHARPPHPVDRRGADARGVPAAEVGRSRPPGGRAEPAGRCAEAGQVVVFARHGRRDRQRRPVLGSIEVERGPVPYCALEDTGRRPRPCSPSRPRAPP